MHLSASLATDPMTLNGHILDGVVSFRIDDIAQIRGAFAFEFDHGEISEPDAPVLIYLIELMHFFGDLTSSDGVHSLQLYFEPRLYASVKNSKVTFTLFRPDEARPSGVLETVSIDEAKAMHYEVERQAKKLFHRFSGPLEEYLWSLARARQRGV